MPAGRTIRLLVEIEGQAPFLSVNRYVAADADGATVERTRFTLAAEPLGEPVQGRETWLEFQTHASFPSGMPIKYTTQQAGQVTSVVTVIEDTLQAP